MIESKYDDKIYIIKFFAILSVICAHCSSKTYENPVLSVLNTTMSVLGTIGVPLFFIVSGYLFRPFSSIEDLFSRKKKIIIQWFFWGSLVWTYMIIRKGFNYARLDEWLLGYHTYLWYMSVLFIFFLIFSVFRSKTVIITTTILSLIYFVVKYDLVNKTDYVGSNVIIDSLGMVFWFSFGMCLKLGLASKLLNVMNSTSELAKRIVFLMIILGTLVVAIYIKAGEISYLSSYFIIFELLCAILIWGIAEKMEHKNNFIVCIGKDSFLIYLIHMPITGALSNVISRTSYTSYLILIIPIITMIVSELLILLFRKILHNYPHLLVFV